MSRRVHMCVDIAGVYNWPDAELSAMFRGADVGFAPFAKDIRDFLRAEMKAGKRKLPIGEPCEGWSDVTGCPGHEVNTGREGA